MNNFHRYRFTTIGIILTAACAAILAQMIHIQTSASAQAFEAQKKMFSGEVRKIYPPRGLIVDRWGHLLAGNEIVYEVGVDLQLRTDPKAIATTLATILGSDYSSVLARASLPFKEGESQYALLADFVSPAKIDEIKKAVDDWKTSEATRNHSQNLPSLAGLTWSPHLARSYPEKTVGSNVLGFFSYRDRNDGRGYYGVEEKYNDRLAGAPQDIYIPFDPYLAQGVPEVPPGDSLILTIDRGIQAAMENILDQAIKDTGSASGTIVVMDPKTGELLAIATTPRMDPNEYWKYSDVFPKSVPFDRAVSETYETGSVFKVLTMASALDSGTVKPETQFVDTGVFEIGGAYIYNWNGGAWGPQDMTGCMAHSLNVCLAWVASQMGTTTFYDYIRAFGIGHLTGVDLAGEAYGPLRVPGDSNWYKVDLGTNAFGQGVAATPIQMVMAVSAVANNEGKMMAPHVLRAVISNGRQYPTLPQVIGTPIKAETARTLTGMLARSIETETQAAMVKGYRVAGKTGTAEIPTPTGYSDTLTNASFVGWGPIDDPRFLVYVWLEKPTTSKWGSVVAAPVFSQAVAQLVVLMDIPPDEVRQQLAAEAAAASAAPAAVADPAAAPAPEPVPAASDSNPALEAQGR